MAAGASGVLMIFLVMDAMALKDDKFPALFKALCSIVGVAMQYAHAH